MELACCPGVERVGPVEWEGSCGVLVEFGGSHLHVRESSFPGFDSSHCEVSIQSSSVARN
jgi:hypothetical protein